MKRTKTRRKMLNQFFIQSIMSCGIFLRIIFESSIGKTPAEILLNLEISRCVDFWMLIRSLQKKE